MLETVCVIYDFIGEMIYCWHHYRNEFLKSVRISKIIISQIYITNKIKNFGKRVTFKYLIDDFAGPDFLRMIFVICHGIEHVYSPTRNSF